MIDLPQAVVEANKVPVDALLQQLIASEDGSQPLLKHRHDGTCGPTAGVLPDVNVDLVGASQLSRDERDAIFELFESNMKSLYETSSMGWHPDDKKAELFHDDSRFIRVLDSSQGTHLIAYTMFRFDTEEDLDEHVLPVLYCYELQVSETWRGKQVGRLLVACLERIGTKQHMQKVMLTAFNANPAAQRFYRKLGFDNDEICPSWCQEEDEDDDAADYAILSKPTACQGPASGAGSKSKRKKKKKKKKAPAKPADKAVKVAQ